jgi:hypothetical protein
MKTYTKFLVTGIYKIFFKCFSYNDESCIYSKYS